MNRFVNIPTCLSECKKLMILNLSNNFLIDIEPAIVRLQNLVNLNLSKNLI